MLVKENRIGGEEDPIDLWKTAKVANAREEFGIDEASPTIGVKPTDPPLDLHIIIDGFFKNRIAHEARGAFLKLIGTEDAIRVAQVGELQVELEWPEGHRRECLFDTEERPADPRRRFSEHRMTTLPSCRGPEVVHALSPSRNRLGDYAFCS